MPRNNLLVRIAAAIVGIVAIGFAAATIESPTESGGSSGVGDGSGEGFSTPESEPPMNPDGVTEIPAFLEFLGLIILGILAVVIAWYLVMNRRNLVRLVAVYLAVIAVVVGLVWIITEFGISAPEPPNPMENRSNASEPGGDGLGSGEGEQTDSSPISFGPILLILGLVAAAFGAVFVLSKRDTSDASGAISPTEAGDDAAAIGAVAGRAADRIDETNDEDVDNAVYRAWRDMTRHLEVDRPETSTPGEFATAAVAAGIEREHVDELTRLFEEVRYGDADTTRERETRAESVLRRIEAEYADDGEDPDGGATTRGPPGGDDS